MFILQTLLLPIAAYCIGAIPFSLIFVRWRSGIDLRQFGSGNLGATNARRAAGTLIGIAALICDALKGALPTWFALYLIWRSSGALPDGYAALVALAAIVGHMFPVYLKFNPSGKGVATTLGCYLVLAPLAVVVTLVVFLGVVLLFRRMSLGSLIAAAVLPPTVWVTTHDWILLLGSALITILIVLRHKTNIQRLFQGTEPRV